MREPKTEVYLEGEEVKRMVFGINWMDGKKEWVLICDLLIYTCYNDLAEDELIGEIRGGAP